jgi:hypothetical protein
MTLPVWQSSWRPMVTDALPRFKRFIAERVFGNGIAR